MATARPPLSARTTVAGVIGDPIRHSLSPAILNAAFDAAGLDWAFVAFEVPDGAAGDALAAMRTLGLGGLSVTMPHKAAVAGAVDRLAGDAAALGAVNCVAVDGDRLVGHNTDGPGLLRSLARDADVDVAGARCLVLGAGGAARAAVAALAAAGAAEVVVVNRTRSRAEAAAGLAGPVGRVGVPDDVAGVDVVVNATSVGMAHNPGLPVDAALLRPGQVVLDAVYQPLRTELLAAAEAAGAVAVDGLGMLVGQAGVAFELWTGVPAPLDAMGRAARAGLAGHPVV